MKKGKFITILCFIFTLLLCPFSIFADDDIGEVIIQTDGTYNDHEVIQACEVGQMVKLDIGSFDTAYVNNNFDVNRNIDGYIMFECQQVNDIKLAYYAINQTVFHDYTSGFSDAQLDYLNSINYRENSDLFMYTFASYEFLYVSYDVTYDADNSTVVMNGFDKVDAQGNVETTQASSTVDITQTYRLVLYLKDNFHIYFEGLPEDITTMYSIYTSVDPSGSGTVEGGGWYHLGDTVTLTAIANEGYVFTNWNNNSISETITFTVTGSVSYIAYFALQPSSNTYTVSATVSPQGYGYVDGTGTYSEGSLVTLSAHANEGYIFKEWNTGSTSNYLTFNINENRDYIAYFEIDPNYTPPEEDTITVSGSVSPLNSGYIQGLGEYEPGADVTLTAVANEGYTFVQWNNGYTSPTQTINSMSDINVIAYFVSNDSTSTSILYENQYILLDYVCDNNSSYTYRQRVRTIKAPNMNVYASISNSGDYQLIAKDVNEFVISGILDYKTSGSCSFVPYLQESETSFLSDGSLVTSDDGYVTYKFVLTEKHDPIVDGTTESNLATDKNEQQNAELDSVITEYNEIEGQFKDNLDTSLNDIDFSFDFGNITDFSTSANFVRSQFDNLTNNPFGSLVGFSLAVGLALLIMGRRL